MKQIDKLEELTKKLPEIFVKSVGVGFNEVETDSGSGILFALYNIPEVSVVRGVLTEGTKIPPTVITEKTWVVLFKGEILVSECESKGEEICLGNETILRPGDYIVWDVGTIQSAESLTDSETITITIPATGRFPKEMKS